MKLKKKLIMLSFLTFLTLGSTNVFAGFDNVDYDILTEDEHRLPTSIVINGKQGKTNMASAEGIDQKRRDSVATAYANAGALIYVRNGYGGGGSAPYNNEVDHQGDWSFQILMPNQAAGDSFRKQELYSFEYIDYNKTYKAGNSGQNAYGYPSQYSLPNKANRYALKLIQADPEYRTFKIDYSGHIPMVTMSKGKKTILGEYRFNGVSGNGESINNPFFPDDISHKVTSTTASEIWTKTTWTQALTGKPCAKYNGQTLTLYAVDRTSFPDGGKSLIGNQTFENINEDIAENALTTLFNEKFIGGSSAAYTIKPWDEWNKYIKIDNSPLTGSATYTIQFQLSGGGRRYNSIVIPSDQINDVAIKSIVIFDVDEEGKLIQKPDGSYQTMAEFSRQRELISSMYGNQRVNAPLLAGKEYVIGVNIMNVNAKKSKTINLSGSSDVLNNVFVNTYSVTIPKVDEVLKMPEEIKYVKDGEGNDTLIREPIYGEWLQYTDVMEAYDWSKIDSTNFEYRPTFNDFKMNDHKEGLDNLTFQGVDRTTVRPDTSIAAGGINSESGTYNPDAVIKAKGNGNAMIITAVLPFMADYNSNYNNDMGQLIVPIAVNDMGMDKMVVKDPQGKIVPEGGSLDKDVTYTVDYIVKKVTGEKKVENTTILTKVIDKNNVPFTSNYYSSKDINTTQILSIGNPVDSKGSFTINRNILPDDTIRVCGEISQDHTKRAENIANQNDYICQEFKSEKNDMSIVEIKLKDTSTGKYVTEVSPNKSYEAIFTVKKESGQKVVNPTTIDTTINGGSKLTNSTTVPLEPSKTVEITRPVLSPNNADRMEICGEIVTMHDTKGENIRNAGDKLCKVFGKKLNFYVQNLQANPREVILPDNKSTIPSTPFALSFKAGFESVADDTRTVQIVIKDYQNRVVWTGTETFVSGEERNIIAPVVINNVGLGSYQYTVEINPNRNPAEVIPSGDPYADNKASTTFTVARNFNCFECYEKNTRIDWVLEYTTTISPGAPYSYPYCTNYHSSHGSGDNYCSGYCISYETRWACTKYPEYKTVDKQQVSFFEVYRFDQILFRSKYTQDNAAAMRAKGATISNDGWLDVLNLPSNLKKFVGIKSGYGFELKVVTYYDHNFSCERSIPGQTVECNPSLDRDTTPIDCWSASDSVRQIRYQGNSTSVPTGGFLPSYISPQTSTPIVCVEWPFKDDYGNTAKSQLSLTGSRGGRPNEIWRTYELPSRDVVKKGVFERKMYVNRDVSPNIVSGPTYTVKLQTNRKQGIYSPSGGARQGYLQDCFNFDIYIVGKMEEDMITHIMD